MLLIIPRLHVHIVNTIMKQTPTLERELDMHKHIHTSWIYTIVFPISEMTMQLAVLNTGTHHIGKYHLLPLNKRKNKGKLKNKHSNIFYAVHLHYKKKIICFSGETVWALIRSVIPSTGFKTVVFFSLNFNGNYRDHHNYFPYRLFNCKTPLMLIETFLHSKELSGFF